MGRCDVEQVSKLWEEMMLFLTIYQNPKSKKSEKNLYVIFADIESMNWEMPCSKSSSKSEVGWESLPLLVSSLVEEHGDNGSGGTGKMLVVNSSFKEDCFLKSITNL